MQVLRDQGREAEAPESREQIEVEVLRVRAARRGLQVRLALEPTVEVGADSQSPGVDVAPLVAPIKEICHRSRGEC
jgi:hypothetical protein